ncbi:tryptophan-rich sensory protein [Olleya sp. YS]|uniref:TspO/MBR family protein n=1 Tax=Olleya sp. YS TaxID=3028318 RepID=UPI00243446D5|nr:tryptophan-rich sensory protein [Olleya sp. YS]WGD34842.1 tryptophan-rich sensory protein [Olleya sp. YS]
MKLLKPLLLFLVINFGGLALGSWLMDNGPSSEWYNNLNQAPWTPPGWVFGVAWTTIMICFSIYLAYLFTKINTQKLKLVFALQVFLNVVWNYIFFNQHQVFLGLITITALTIVIFYFFFNYRQEMKNLSYLLLPYMVWLLIATSLNGYILLNN